jgi:hypothetical protein
MYAGYSTALRHNTKEVRKRASHAKLAKTAKEDARKPFELAEYQFTAHALLNHFATLWISFACFASFA